MRIGIIGGGQLGQMLGYAGTELGLSCEFLDPSPASPASAAGPVTPAAFDDETAIRAMAGRVDVLTYEFENVPVASLEAAAGDTPVYPPLGALANAQDRLLEKQLFRSLDIDLPGWHAVDTRADLDRAAATLGLPVVLKTRRLGYDGKGQVVIQTEGDLDNAWAILGGNSLIAEAWVPFDYEVSAIAARSVSGEIEHYPLTNNIHEGGILRFSRAPVDAPGLAAMARDYIGRLLEELNYVGVLALELFVHDGRLLANEMAPRVHNSGHWTIEGAETSQFANHLLTVAGERPGSAEAAGYAGMLNLIGQIPDSARQLAVEGATLHDYGKSPRDGRKLGHVNVVAESAELRDEKLRAIARTVVGTSPHFPALG